MLPLVEIPALGCDAGLYQPLNAELGIDGQVIIATADRLSACVDQILAAAPPEFILFGTSFGARVALETVVRAPQRVRALIVTGGGPGPTIDQTAGLLRGARARHGEFEQVLQEMGDIVSHLPGPRGAATMEAFRAMGRMLGAEKFASQSDAMAHRIDLWPRISEIACPVLCLWGDHDQYSGAETGSRIATTVKDGTCVILPDCGHFPMLEYPVESARVVRDWLDNSMPNWRA